MKNVSMASAHNPQDKIKSSLGRPSKGMKPTGTLASVPRGKNFKPKGMGGKK